MMFDWDTAKTRIANLRPGEFLFPVTERGRTAHFNVFTDNDLGHESIEVAQGVLDKCEADYNELSKIFGGQRPEHINVIITFGRGGVHSPCTGTDLYCGSSGTDAEFTSRIVVMEEAEVFEAFQGAGWDCLTCNGEALSRVLAEQFHPPQGESLISAPLWLAGERKDSITENHCNDLDAQPIGCAVLFLYYLRFQLGFSWNQIVQAGGPTLAKVYKKLTGKNDAFQSFIELINHHFPRKRKGELKKDNPFPLPPLETSLASNVRTSGAEAGL